MAASGMNLEEILAIFLVKERYRLVLLNSVTAISFFVIAIFQNFDCIHHVLGWTHLFFVEVFHIVLSWIHCVVFVFWL